MVSNPTQTLGPFIDCFQSPTRFDHFMHQALYAPGLGYYARGESIFGAQGDFITAPQLSPLFGQTLALATQQALTACQGKVIEFGAGLGHLAAAYIASAGAALHEYCIVEVSSSLCFQQAQFLQQTLKPSQYAKVRWLDTLPQPLCGLVLANEVLDAQPVRRFCWQGSNTLPNTLHECFVQERQGQLHVHWQAADPALHQQVAALHNNYGPWPAGYTSEWHEQTTAWVRTITENLHGVVLVLDYGHSAAQYYHPSRSQGTLRAMHQHVAHDDFLQHIGQQDLTAHVNFSAVYQALNETGGELQGYTTQGAFLLAHGLLALAQQEPHWTDPARGGPMRQAVNTMVSHAAMGEAFKVMCWSKGVNLDGSTLQHSFLAHDRSGVL